MIIFLRPVLFIANTLLSLDFTGLYVGVNDEQNTLYFT